MMFGSTTPGHMLFLSVLMLMSEMATAADAVSVFRKSPDIELGRVYNSENTVMSSLVVSNGHCGLICDELGDDQCQSFNVKPEGNQIRCELFDHQPREVASIVPHPTGQLFEEECETFKVTASAKVTHGAIETVTLIDVNRGVYRLTSASPRPRFIGSVEEVFVDFHHRVDDIIFWKQIPPFGDVYLIRSGILMFCYKSVDEEHELFIACDKDSFPIGFASVFPVERADVWNLKLAVGNEHAVMFLWEDGITKASFTMNGKSTSLKDLLQFSGAQEYDCNYSEYDQFCSLYQPFWFAASSAIYLGGDSLGLFVGTKVYTFDMVTNVILERYPLCKRNDLLFFF